MEKRLAFGAVFLLGTLAAAVGWLSTAGVLLFLLQRLRASGITTPLTIAGHALQIIGVIGAMLVPEDAPPGEAEETFGDE